MREEITTIELDIENKKAQLQLQKELLSKVRKLLLDAEYLIGEKVEPFTFVNMANEVGDKIGDVIQSRGDSKKAQVTTDEDFARLLQRHEVLDLPKTPGISQANALPPSLSSPLSTNSSLSLSSNNSKKTTLSPNASSFQPAKNTKQKKSKTVLHHTATSFQPSIPKSNTVLSSSVSSSLSQLPPISSDIINYPTDTISSAENASPSSSPSTVVSTSHSALSPPSSPVVHRKPSPLFEPSLYIPSITDDSLSFNHQTVTTTNPFLNYHPILENSRLDIIDPSTKQPIQDIRALYMPF